MANQKEGKFRIGLAQFACSLNPDENLAKALETIREAAGKGAQIICLPELFRSQYFCREENAELFDLAEPIPGPSTEAIGKVAREHRVAVVASLFERRAAGAVSQHGGDARCRWRAARDLPQDAHPGRSAVLREVLFHARRYRVSQLRHAIWADRDARLLGPVVSRRRAAVEPRRGERAFLSDRNRLAPSEKEQYGAAQLDAWRTIQRAHAIANGIYVCAVNRIGFEGPPDHGLEFWGSSFIADPFGQVIAQASVG